MKFKQLVDWLKKHRSIIIEGSAFLLIVIAVIYFSIEIYRYLHPDKILLLCSSEVVNDEAKIEPYLLPNVIPVIYDYFQTDSFTNIIQLIKETMQKNNITRFKRVGMMFHTSKKFTLKMFRNDKEREITTDRKDMFEQQMLEVYDDFILFSNYVHHLTNAEYLDVIACYVVPATNKAIYDYFNDMSDMDINFSMTAIGGDLGNWFLEQGDVPLIGTYFNKNIETSNIVLIA